MPISTGRVELILPNRGTLFFNPSSGAKLSEEDGQALQAAAQAAGLDVIELKEGVDVPKVMRKAMAGGQRLFVAAGGDGTVNCVVQLLVEHPEAELAVVPVGTYNHFARDLRIPLDWKEALDVALQGEARRVDAVKINDQFFVNNISIGLYPEMVAHREKRGRHYPRWKARLFAIYKTLQRFPHVTLKIETNHHQEVLRTHVFMVSNNSYDLSQIGVEASRGTLEEGKISVYWLPHIRRIALMKFVANYLAGRVHTTPGFRSFRNTKLKVASSRPTIKVGVDGELVTFKTPLQITSVPQSLTVRVPKPGQPTSAE